MVLGELPDLPHLPELPARGVGADLTGRTAALLVDLPVETTAGRWKLAARPGRDQRRAAGLLSADLDALQEAAADWTGPFKVQVCGPWTLAATIELTRSQNPALADPGAVADLIASLAEGVAGARRGGPQPAPRRHAAAAAGRARPARRSGRLGPDRERAQPGGSRGQDRDHATGLRSVLAATTAFGLVHCCARGIPFGLIREAGAQAVAFDLGLLRREERGQPGRARRGRSWDLRRCDSEPATRRAAPLSARPGTLVRTCSACGTGWGSRPAGSTGRWCSPRPAGWPGRRPPLPGPTLARCREAARLLPELIEEGVGMTEPLTADPAARQRHAALAVEITEHLHRYHVLDSPVISDAEYDALMRELRRARGALPGPAHARLADPEGRRRDLHRLRRRSSTWSGCSAWTTRSRPRSSTPGRRAPSGWPAPTTRWARTCAS